MSPLQFLLALIYGAACGALFYTVGYLVGDREPTVSVGWFGVVQGLVVMMALHTRWRR